MRRLVLAVIVCCLASCTDASAAARSWVGAGGGGDGVSWSDNANWDPAGAPGTGDDVTISADSVLIAETAAVKSLSIGAGAFLRVAGTGAGPTTQLPLDPAATNAISLAVAEDLTLAGSLSIGGRDHLADASLSVGSNLTLSGTANLAVYAGKGAETTWQAFKAGGAQVTVGGATTLGDTSAVYPIAHRMTGLPVVFDLQDLDVAAGAQINADAAGFGYVDGAYYGDGAPSAYAGGSYGGRGGRGSTVAPAPYGFAYAPYKPGSPGYASAEGKNGGGAIRIRARGVTLSGTMTARGAAYGGYGKGCGSGGSVWITCSNFTAVGSSALITAEGGIYTGYSSPNGGGGRVAIMTDSPTEAQIDALYQTGTCNDLIVVTDDMSDPVASPYPDLVNVLGGHGQNYASNPTASWHGQDGTSAWLVNKGDGLQLSVWGNIVPVATTPAYGVSKQTAGALSFSAPLYHVVPGSDGMSRYICAGFSWSNSLVQTGSGSSNEFSLTLSADTWVNWNYATLQHYVKIRTAGIGQSDMTIWTNEGSTVSVSAPSVAGYTFLGWEGDVPDTNRQDSAIALTVSHPLLVTAVYRSDGAATAVSWTGGGDGLSWGDGSNWSTGTEPYANDAVTIPAGTLVQVDYHAVARALTLASGSLLCVASTGSVVSADSQSQQPLLPAAKLAVGLRVLDGLTIDGGSVSVGGVNNASDSVRLVCDSNLTLTGAAKLAVHARYGEGATWEDFKTGGAQVCVTGKTSLAGTSVIYPTCNRKSGLGVVFSLNDLEIGATASIDATARGWGYVDTVYYGTGYSSGDGGSYGGLGGGYSPAPIYGHRFAPWQPGSPGNYANTTAGGGGSVRIDAGDISLAGAIRARGGDYAGHCGSGGSILIACNTLTPTGGVASLDARGGQWTAYSYNCGGGGRIAVIENSPTDEQLDGLYDTGTCDNLIVITTNMSDAATSPYPTLASVLGGHGQNYATDPNHVRHGKNGTAVWLRNRGSEVQVTVSGNVTPMDTTPAYGVSTQPMGDLNVAAPEYGPAPGFPGNARYTCSGFTWSNSVGQSGSVSATSGVVSLTADTWIDWQWTDLEYRLDLSSGGNGTVYGDGWHAADSAASISAVADGGAVFTSWAGDVPEGQRAQANTDLTMDGPKQAVAIFSLTAPRDMVWVAGVTGSWFEPTNWLAGSIPGVNDSVLITSGVSIVSLPGEIEIADLTVAGGGSLFHSCTGASAAAAYPVDADGTNTLRLTVTGGIALGGTAQCAIGGYNGQARTAVTVGGALALSQSARLALYAGYGGPTNQLATYRHGGGSLAVAGDTTLADSSVVELFCHQASGAPVVMQLADLAVGAGARIDADYNGFGRIENYDGAVWAPLHYGPGYREGIWTANRNGGSYGGRGGGNPTNSVYGFAAAPYMPGSPAYDNTIDNYRLFAGGAIRISAAAVELNGTLTANGRTGRTYRGGSSGGAIWLTCVEVTLGGTAMLSADGGNAYSYNSCSGGGGGRIAVCTGLTSDQIDDLYNTGAARRLAVRNLDEVPEYAGKFSVAGGWGKTDENGEYGEDGSAVLVEGIPPAGTMIVVK